MIKVISSFDMKTLPINAYKLLRVPHVVNAISRTHVHVSTTLVAIFREVSYKRYIL